MIFLLQFIMELKKGLKYLILALIGCAFVISLLLGLSWGAGWVIDKILNIGQLTFSNYVVYGAYALISVFISSIFVIAISGWILLAYKAVIDRMKK